MAFSKTHDETTPSNSTNANQIDDKIVDFKIAERERQAVEHCRYADETGHTDVGEHKKGSARAGFGLATNIGAVNANNPGGLYKETDAKRVMLDNGTTWEELIERVASLLVSGGTLTLTDANGKVVRDSSNALTLASLLDQVMLSGKTGCSLNVNCIFDGTQWNRINVGASATRLLFNNNGYLRYYKASAGANPIASWDLYNNVLLLDTNGTVPGITANLTGNVTGDITGTAGNAITLNSIASLAYAKSYEASSDVLLSKFLAPAYYTCSASGPQQVMRLFIPYPGSYNLEYKLATDLANNLIAVSLCLGLGGSTIIRSADIAVTNTSWTQTNWPLILGAGTYELYMSYTIGASFSVMDIKLCGRVATVAPSFIGV